MLLVRVLGKCRFCVIRTSFNGATDDTTDTCADARRQDDESERELLVLRLVKIGDQTEGNTATGGGKTTLKRKSVIVPGMVQVIRSSHTRARLARMLPKLLASAAGRMKMLMRVSESWRIGQRPNSSLHGAHSSQPKE